MSITAENILAEIKKSLQKCATGTFADAAEELLKTLGYKGDRILESLENPVSAKEFFESATKAMLGVKAMPKTKSAKSFIDAVKSVQMLFQFGEDEIEEARKKKSKGIVQDSLIGKGGFSEKEIDSFFFFAVELGERKYSRSEYAAFTREINKIFNTPSVVLFRSGKAGERRVTLSFVGRRENKKDSDRDVLERVSLLREIGCELRHQHRGHVNVLEQLAVGERLKWMEQNGKAGFAGLLAAWLDELDAEALNRRFYLDLREWFNRAIKTAKFPTGKVTPQQQVVRMIGRLLFIWFMKERELVSEGLFNERRMSVVLVNYDRKGDSYYRAILQNLFFATLNTEIDKRDFSERSQKTHRDTSLYRYKDLMKNPDEVLGMMKEQTPFVNGGLFDCLDDFDGVNRGGERIDCFTDNGTQRKQLSVPNSLFFGVDGVFKILRRYKFTVEENTPIEQEVALDPELLGKVFEEFLGHVAPQEDGVPIEKSKRKETGSYYTPRVVVDYMTRESLVAYFAKKIKDAKKNLQERIRRLLSPEVDYDVLPNNEKLNESESEQFVKAAGILRLLDPAVGSGAFLMGVLQQLAMALLRIDPDNKFLRERELKVARMHTDDDVRKNAIEQVKVIFSKRKKQYHYARKLSLIRDCLFGVDIQTIAVQICRLRFFISLLIEQEIDRTKDNLGILPLPNMDAKILAADTLIGLADVDEKRGDQSYLSSKEVRERRDNIRDIRRMYFNARTRDEKKDLMAQDRQASMELAEFLRTSSYGDKNERKIDDAGRIAAWDLYDQNTVADWFDAAWMFGVESGFDIVIGNPPYVQLQKNRGWRANLYAPQNYKTFARTGDIYGIFYERGLQLCQSGGHLCYITSNKWMRAGYGEKLRIFFLTKNPLLLLDLGPDVFTATVDTNIFLIQNAKNCNELRGCTITAKDIAEAAKNVFPLKFEKDKVWSIVQLGEAELQRKIEEIGTPLQDWLCISTYRGITTGYNDAFIIDKAKRQDILRACADNAERIRTDSVIRSVMRGRGIKRYYTEWAGLYLLFVPWHFPLHEDMRISGASLDAENAFKNQYPALYTHLLTYKQELSNRNKDETGIRYEWYALQRFANTYLSEFEKDKIVWQRVTRRPTFCISPKGRMVLDSMAFIAFQSRGNYILAVVNSKVIAKWVDMNVHQYGTAGYRLSNQYVEQIPVPQVTNDNAVTVAKIEELAAKVIVAKTANAVADTTKTESEIDKLVYKLYNLTPEEIAIVEKNQ